MAESWATRRARWLFNWFPAYRRTGGRIYYIADDWLEVRVRLRLTWRTRNYHGSLFGGSLYGAIDPVFMMMLIHLLGPEFTVWDKSATIHFRRPGRTTLFATFKLTGDTVRELREAAMASGKAERELSVDLVDADGVVHASARKTIHVRWKRPAAGSGAG